MVLKNSKGQTLVEYILLLAVVTSLVATFFNSALFKRFFGKGGSVGQTIKANSEFAYRHALFKSGTGVDIPRGNRDITQHPSYTDGSNTRFFGPVKPYPDE